MNFGKSGIKIIQWSLLVPEWILSILILLLVKMDSIIINLLLFKSVSEDGSIVLRLYNLASLLSAVIASLIHYLFETLICFPLYNLVFFISLTPNEPLASIMDSFDDDMSLTQILSSIFLWAAIILGIIYL